MSKKRDTKYPPTKKTTKSPVQQEKISVGFDISTFANKELLKEHNKLLKAYRDLESRYNNILSVRKKNASAKEAKFDKLNNKLESLKSFINELDSYSYGRKSRVDTLLKRMGNIKLMTLDTLAYLPGELEEFSCTLEFMSENLGMVSQLNKDLLEILEI